MPEVTDAFEIVEPRLGLFIFFDMLDEIVFSGIFGPLLFLVPMLFPVPPTEAEARVFGRLISVAVFAISYFSLVRLPSGDDLRLPILEILLLLTFFFAFFFCSCSTCSANGYRIGSLNGISLIGERDFVPGRLGMRFLSSKFAGVTPIASSFDV